MAHSSPFLRVVSGIAGAAIVCSMLWTLPAEARQPADAGPGLVLVRARPDDIGFAESAGVGFGWTAVPAPPGLPPEAAARSVALALRRPAVPNVVLHFAQTSEPLFDRQWALENDGSDGGTPDADVDAAAAWTITTGDPSIVVAVLDTGIDTDHPDLAGRLWANDDEIAGNGVDDDGNGYVDDVMGWDFHNGDALPEDESSHGTAVAGTIAAAINGVGIAGLAPDVRIMPLRVGAGSTTELPVVAAMAYAIDNGADVINLSLETSEEVPALRDAIAAAGDEDIVVVAAAGNWEEPQPRYPARYDDLPALISVGATDRDDEPAGFSNWGAQIAAPGVGIWTTDIGDWNERSGTSFSAPLAAAAAALLRSAGAQKPADGVVNRLLATADPLGGSPGFVESGRLNAARALTENAAPLLGVDVPPMGVAPFEVDTSSAADDADGIVVRRDWWLNGAPIEPSGSSIVVTDVGSYTLELEAEDDDGSVVGGIFGFLVGEAFTDIAASVFFGDIVWLSASGITRGCDADRFCPDRPVTRGEFAAFVRRWQGLPDGPDAFGDDGGHLFEGDLNALAAAGILRGCNPPDDDQVCPDDLLTRGQAAAMLRRALDLTGSPTDHFVDDDGNVFEGDLDALAAAGILRGCNPPDDDQVCPGDPLTRGQAAAVLHRAGGG